MKITLSGDIENKTKLSELIYQFNIYERLDFFSKGYGEPIDEIFMVLFCHKSTLIHKKRVRFVKKEKVLYHDIIINYEKYMPMTWAERKEYVAKEILSELEKTIKKYRFKDFDLERFIGDLGIWLKKLGWLKK